MSATAQTGDRPRVRWRQAAWITAGAAALALGLHFLPSRPGLSHLDFIAGGADALEFCDPANPRFLAVVARSSPVAMSLASTSPQAGARVEATLVLHTLAGRPIGPADLVPTAAGKLVLLLIDPSGEDFQMAPARPGARPGDWSLAFTPRRTGTYRAFADFIPVATQREMYAAADLAVGGSAAPGGATLLSATAEAGGWRFTLRAQPLPLLARQPVELVLAAVPLGDGAAPRRRPGRTADLVICDAARTGFVLLHAGPPGTPGAGQAGGDFRFKVTIAEPGRYFAWCQIDVGGAPLSARLPLEVAP